MPYVGYDSRIEWPSAQLAALIAAGGLSEGKAIDLGCGDGTEALFLARHGGDVLGIDTARDAIRAARERRAALPPAIQRRVRFSERSVVGHAPQRSAVYQLILDRLVLNNLGKRERMQVLRAVARLLEPGGVYVLRTYDINRFTKQEWTFLRDHFECGPAVEYRALVTDPLETDGALVVSTRDLRIRLFERKEDAALCGSRTRHCTGLREMPRSS